MVITPMRGQKIDMKCLDTMASFLFYAVIVDFSLELLDFIHRLYQSEESIKILSEMVSNRLFISLVIIQVLLGMLIPLSLMVAIRLFRFEEELRKLLYFLTVILIQLGIFATRWNVVVGGQMFSKSFRGLTAYKMELGGIEGLLMTLALLILPLIILAILLRVFPAWNVPKGALGGEAASST
jgi:predicted membrane-bound spermidine synthase